MENSQKKASQKNEKQTVTENPWSWDLELETFWYNFV